MVFSRSTPFLFVTVVSIFLTSSWITNINAAAPVFGGSYLYNTEDALPVLDHGLSGSDFTKSTSPKVVEFYHPKCGACQAFKSNFVEAAKKVRSQIPNVEFYGVSCEAYQSLCDEYGGPGVPKIFAFPSDGESNSGGIEVPKGAGTIYFFSARLVKALRTPEETASDAEKLGSAEAPKRRLGESPSADEGYDKDSEDGNDAEEVSEDGSGDEEVSEDGDDEGEVSEDADEDVVWEEDNGESYGSQDIVSNDHDEKNKSFEDEEDESEDDGERPSDEHKNQSQGSGDRSQEASSDEPTPRGRHEDVAVLDKHTTNNRAGQVSIDNEEHSGDIDQENSEGSQNRQDASEEQGQQPPAKRHESDRNHSDRNHSDKNHSDRNPSERNHSERNHPERNHSERNQVATDQLERYKHTDAYKNTMREFQKIDIKEGKPKGYHFNKMKTETAEVRLRGARKIAAQTVPISNESIGGDTRKREMNPEDKDRGARMDDARGITAQEKPSSRQSIGGEIRQKEATPEDNRHAKSVLGRDFFPQKKDSPHSASIPIVNINKPQEKGDAHRIPPPPPPPTRSYERTPFGPINTDPNFDPVATKKFQEYLAGRKRLIERKEKMKHPIRSIFGKEETEAKKSEKNDIGAIHKKTSLMRNYKSQYNEQANASREPKADLRHEAQHKTLGEVILKKIPIVKRAFKRSKGEEILNDAALSFTRGLLMGLFKTNQPLDYKKKTALVDWFDLLRVSLPPEIGLHELIDTLKYNIDSVSQRRENLLVIIDKHPLPDNFWSDDCSKGLKQGGFFCGFWKLLHVMSIGFAEQAGGLSLRESHPSIRVFSAKEAGSVLREYMALFFNCNKCSQRFIGQYDDCSFQRCHRLSDETVDATPESWQEFPLWLWQVHNDISRSKSIRASDFHEKEGRRADAKRWEKDMKAVYPHIDQCITCVSSAGMWKLNEVYSHLEKEYWALGSEIDPKFEKFLEYNDVERGNVFYRLVAYFLIVLIMILLALFAKKYQIRATGRHKKSDPSSFDRMPEKYRNS